MVASGREGEVKEMSQEPGKKPVRIWWIDHNIGPDLGLSYTAFVSKLETCCGTKVDIKNISNWVELMMHLALISDGQSHDMPNLIITELGIPESFEDARARIIKPFEGFYFWSDLRRREKWGKELAQVPVIVFTGESNPDIRQAMTEDSLTRWERKPAHQTLLEMIASFFKV